MSFWGNDDDNEDDDENEEEEQKIGKDRIIFLIDSRKPMFESNSKGEPHIINCLSIALAVMKTKVVASDNASIGITFFGTREFDQNEETEGVYTLFPLRPPTAQVIRELQNLVSNLKTFEDTIGSQSIDLEDCPLKQAFWSCSQAFDSAKKSTTKSLDSKRIWLFTNDDNPNKHDDFEQDSTVTVARDAIQAGVEFSLWHLDPAPLRAFDPSLFFRRLLDVQTGGGAEEDDVGSDARVVAGGTAGFDASVASVRRKEHKKRRLGSFWLSMGDPLSTELKMGVQLYKTVSVCKKPTHTWLFSRTNQALKSTSKYYDSATGEVLDAGGIDTFLEVAGSRLPFSPAEMNGLKLQGNVARVGIQLLRFVGQKSVGIDLVLESPYFLYPDEEEVRGSNEMFEALLRDMARKGLVALVRFNRTLNTVPRMAALWPQVVSGEGEKGAVNMPVGFHLLPLPFSEDIRSNPKGTVNPVQDAGNGSSNNKMLEKMTEIIKTLQFPSDFAYHTEIENPAIQQYYSVLQAVALNETSMSWDPVRDDTMQPDEEKINSHRELFLLFKEFAGLSDVVAQPSKKRAAAGDATEKPRKKAKPSLEIDQDLVREWISNGQLSKQTVVTLKEAVKILGINGVSGNKQNFVSAILEFCA